MPDENDSSSLTSIVTVGGVRDGLLSLRVLDAIREYALKCPHKTSWSGTKTVCLTKLPIIHVKFKATRNKKGGDENYILVMACDPECQMQPGDLLLSVDGTCLTFENAQCVIDRMKGHANVRVSYQCPLTMAQKNSTPQIMRTKITEGHQSPVTTTRKNPDPLNSENIATMLVEMQKKYLPDAFESVIYNKMTWRPFRRVVIQFLGDTEKAMPPHALLDILFGGEVLLQETNALCSVYATHLVVNNGHKWIYKLNDVRCSTGTGCLSLDGEVVERVADSLLTSYPPVVLFPSAVSYLLIEKDWSHGVLSTKDLGEQLGHRASSNRYMHVEVLIVHDNELVSAYAPAMYCASAVYIIVFKATAADSSSRVISTLGEIAACCQSARRYNADEPDAAGEGSVPPSVMLLASDDIDPQRLAEVDCRLFDELQHLSMLGCNVLSPPCVSQPEQDSFGLSLASAAPRRTLFESAEVVAQTLAQVLLEMDDEWRRQSVGHRHTLAAALVARSLRGQHGCRSRRQIKETMRTVLPRFDQLDASSQLQLVQDTLIFLHTSGIALVPDEMALSTTKRNSPIDDLVLLHPLDLIDFIGDIGPPAEVKQSMSMRSPEAAAAWRELDKTGVIRRTFLARLVKDDDRSHLLLLLEKLYLILPLGDDLFIVPSHCPMQRGAACDWSGGRPLYIDFHGCLPLRLLLHLLWSLQQECEPSSYESAHGNGAAVVDYAWRRGAYSLLGDRFLLRQHERQYSQLEIRLQSGAITGGPSPDLSRFYARLRSVLCRCLPADAPFEFGPACPLAAECSRATYHVVDISEAIATRRPIYCGAVRIDTHPDVRAWLRYTPCCQPEQQLTPATVISIRTALRDLPEALSQIVSAHLNPFSLLHRDWQGLAAALDIYTSSEVDVIATKPDPTRLLISDLRQRRPQCTIGDLLRHIQNLDRNDVIDDVLQWLKSHRETN